MTLILLFPQFFYLFLRSCRFVCTGRGWHRGLGETETVVVQIEIPKKQAVESEVVCILMYAGPEEVFTGTGKIPLVEQEEMSFTGEIFAGAGKEGVIEFEKEEWGDRIRLGTFAITM